LFFRRVQTADLTVTIIPRVARSRYKRHVARNHKAHDATTQKFVDSDTKFSDKPRRKKNAYGESEKDPEADRVIFFSLCSGNDEEV
jgi:hypothetical protein